VPWWESLIIPLIALAVWILSTVFRGEEEQPKERPRRPGTEGRPRPPRRGTTELDRFLEAARARRNKPIAKPDEQERPPQPEPVVLEAMPVEQPPEKLRPRPSPIVERQPRPRPAKASPPLAEPVRPPVAMPVGPPAQITRPSALPQVPVTETRTPTQNPPGESPPAPAMIVPPTQARRPSPAALKLLEMLKDKQTLAAAVMLREVFDRPLALRRRH